MKTVLSAEIRENKNVGTPGCFDFREIVLIPKVLAKLFFLVLI